MKILNLVVKALGANTGQLTGALSFLKDRTGKISFKRNAAIVVMAYVWKDAEANGGINWMHVALVGVSFLGIALESFVKKDKLGE